MVFAVILFLSGLVYASCDMVDVDGQSIDCGITIDYTYTAVGYRLCHDNGDTYTISCNNILAPQYPPFDEATYAGTCESGGYCPASSSIGSSAGSSVSGSSSLVGSSSGGSSANVSSSVKYPGACFLSVDVNNQPPPATICSFCMAQDQRFDLDGKWIFCASYQFRDEGALEYDLCRSFPPCGLDKSSSSASGSSSGSDGGGDATLENQNKILGSLASHDEHLSAVELEFREYLQTLISQTDLGTVLDGIADDLSTATDLIGLMRGEIDAGYEFDFQEFAKLNTRLDEFGVSLSDIVSEITGASSGLHGHISAFQSDVKSQTDALAKSVNDQASGIHGHMDFVLSDLGRQMTNHFQSASSNFSAIQNQITSVGVQVSEVRVIAYSQAVVTAAQYENLMSAVAGLGSDASMSASSGSGFSSSGSGSSASGSSASGSGSSGSGDASSGSLFDCAGNFYFPRVCFDPGTFETPAEYADCCTGSSSGSDGSGSSGSGDGSSGSRDCSGDMAQDPDCLALAELEKLNSQFAFPSDGLAQVQGRIDGIVGEPYSSASSQFGISSGFLQDFQAEVQASETGKFIDDQLGNWSLASGDPVFTFEALGHTYTLDICQYKVAGKDALEWLGVLFNILAIITAIFIIFG